MKQNRRFIQQFPVEKNNQQNYTWNPEHDYFYKQFTAILFYMTDLLNAPSRYPKKRDSSIDAVKKN